VALVDKHFLCGFHPFILHIISHSPAARAHSAATHGRGTLNPKLWPQNRIHKKSDAATARTSARWTRGKPRWRRASGRCETEGVDRTPLFCTRLKG